MPTPDVTVDELISLLKRASLPTLVVEGATDRALLRFLEEEIGGGVSIIICSGRTNLFQIAEHSTKLGLTQLVFLADQDLNCIQGGHYSHPRLAYTWGYSIENDVLAGSRIDRLLRTAERPGFEMIRDLSAKYFIFEYEKALSEGRSPKWNVSLPEILDIDTYELRAHIKYKKEISEYDTPLYRKFVKQFKKFMRGKNLVQLYMFFLNRPGRESRFTNSALLESCVALGGNRRLGALARAIRAILARSE